MYLNQRGGNNEKLDILECGINEFDTMTVRVNYIGGGGISYLITPKGFWTDVIDIRTSKSLKRDPTTGKCEVESNVDISWGGGGRDDTMSKLDASKSFNKAMTFAIELAEELESELNE